MQMPTSPFKVRFSLENIIILLISQVNLLSERQAHKAQMMPMITQRKSYLLHHLCRDGKNDRFGLLFSVIHIPLTNIFVLQKALFKSLEEWHQQRMLRCVFQNWTILLLDLFYKREPGWQHFWVLTPSLFFSLSDLSILLSDPFYKTEFLVLTATIWCLTSLQQEVI